MLENWMRSRSQDMPLKEWIPKTGVIVDDVACIFLIKTDCKLGFLEFFMTNPEASEHARMEACDLGLKEVERIGRQMGMHTIFANTSIPKVMAVVLRHNYLGDGKAFYFFRKNITQGD